MTNYIVYFGPHTSKKTCTKKEVENLVKNLRNTYKNMKVGYKRVKSERQQ